ncbi:FMN-binding negative transcriptional regulator [Azospirillum sp. RWY-5-1]|uniref:FMN-binding negative transcriptional regulator n=1 Tax=Azospirillum oleiclasticum TaxID=2735135 RepID=A0ABX2TCL7_9PROT|nr:FMN-binding negative transcriptional regulator [Azospirillum oleiclasticum]NYZ15639.1 FMN-binding negative transcriptional regulator [Azospirillum oleiclasticum]NYZ21909.1 FMN-binding negative transcriptional regulator [Azospirillum oleiclasticum]
MYVPPAFRESDRDAIHATMRAAGLASLVTATAEGLICTPLPMLLAPDEGELGTLYGHVAKANPQWRAPPAGDALAIFMGPDAYVSPSWYESKRVDGKVVPTWNYVAVHAYGPVEFFEDADRLLEVVTRLTDRHEGSRAEPWAVADAPPDFIRAQLRGIVGVRLPIARIDAKRKMSQNRKPEDRAGVKLGLAASADPGDRAAAVLIPE